MPTHSDKRPSRLVRPIPALLAVVAGAGLAAAIAMASSTQLGETTDTPGYISPIVAVATVAGTPSYETPDGVLTSWRYHSGSFGGPGEVKLKIFRATGTPGEYEVVGESSLKTLEQDTSYAFNAQIPVKQGDLLGLMPQNGARAGRTFPTLAGNSVGIFPAGDVPVGSTGTTTVLGPDSRVAVSATVESDADHDGAGDDTQDQCPTDASTQGPCPKTADTIAPTLTLGGSTRQKLGSSVVVVVSCSEACSIEGSGSVSTSKPKASKRLSLKPAALTLLAGTSGKLKLPISKKSRRKIKRTLRRHGKATAKVTVTAKDSAGNGATATRRIKLKRR